MGMGVVKARVNLPSLF